MGQTHLKSLPHFCAENAWGNRLVDQNHYSYATATINSSVNTDLNAGAEEGDSFYS